MRTKDLAEQKRIVVKIEKIFAKINEAERLRAESASASAALLPSALHQIFTRAEKNWPTKKLGDIVIKEKFAIVDGPFGTQLHKSDYKKDGIPLVRINNITWGNNFDETDLVFISKEKFNQLKRSAVYPVDVLLAKTSATIGKVALFPDKYKEGLIASSCAKISLDGQKALPEFVVRYLFSRVGLEQIL